MDIKKIRNAVEELVLPVMEDLGFELVDLRILAESGRTILRIMADRPGGITLDECVKLSREISPHLDVADIVPYAYNLEVSSPGLRRPLRKLEDFARFIDQPVAVTTEKTIDGRKRFKGINRGLDDKGSVLIEVDGHTFLVPWTMVADAKLDPELPFGKKPEKR